MSAGGTDEPPNGEIPKRSSLDVLIGQRVKFRREELGISRAELAANIGLASSAIEAIESGSQIGRAHV